ILTVSLLVLSVIAVIGVLAARLIAEFYAGRLEGPDRQLQQDAVTFLLRLFIPQVVLYGVYFVGAGIMNAHRRFGPQMWTPIVNNLVLIAVLLWFHQAYGSVTLRTVTDTQLLVIGLGTTASVAPMGVMLLPYLRRLGRFRPTIRLRHPAMRKLGRLAVFAIGFVMANQVGYIVIQWLANRQQGAYSAYVSAFTFFLMPVGLFVWSITTALVPSLSQHATHERWDEFREQLLIGIRATIFVMLPAALGYLILGEIIVKLLMQHGITTAFSTRLVADVLRFFVLGLVQFSIFQLLVRAFYSMQDARTPFWVNCAVTGVNVALAIPLFAGFGVRGIAGAQAIANTVGMIVLGVLASRRVAGLGAATLARALSRIAVAAVGMTAVVGTAFWVLGRVDLEGFIAEFAGLTLVIVMGGLSYLGFAHLARVGELDYVRNILRPAGRPVPGS
ncbi:MAG: polysaccharide biosynthesis C-terminal domain-containing protein, partial [Actinomycetota bacterium]|nr:polysaccharide biosynthesis C-terminal domain-containing protein [Actinomycetota bacterium]